MNLPKIIFRRSWVYDQALARPENWEKPEEHLEGLVVKLQNDWEEWGDKILREISEILKLSWHEKEIVAYVSYGVIPFSDPLTLNTGSDIHTVTHELIHRIMIESENWPTFGPKWKRYWDKYSYESETFRYETAVHAVHLKVMKKLFDYSVIEKEIGTVKDPEYVKSWDFIKENGPETIIKELTD
jgi:hypothetical protein